MNILITGGFGYIGGRLADYLKNCGVPCSISLAERDILKIPEWAHKYSAVRLELLETKSIDAALSESQPDLVIHLAALNEIESMKDPERAYEVNTRGCLRLLQSCQKFGVERFIYFSTFHVYGQPEESPITELTPTRPFHPYASTHRAAEDNVEFFRHYYGMKTLVCRLSNGYGFPMDPHVNRWSLVFNDLCRQAVTRNRLVLKSSGRQYRDFIALEDIARVVKHFVFDKPQEWENGLFNIGSGSAMTILEVAEFIKQVFQKWSGKDLDGIEIPEGPEKTKDEKKIEFSIKKLLQSGFQLKGNMEGEVVKTLELCSSSFSQKTD
ncbi:NAD-dependent epimerase/dehydratase family protein [Acidobacteriota bacterium]